MESPQFDPSLRDAIPLTGTPELAAERAIIETGMLEEVITLAQNPGLSLEGMARLAQRSRKVRRALLANPSLSEQLLRALSRDPDPDVREDARLRVELGLEGFLLRRSLAAASAAETLAAELLKLAGYPSRAVRRLALDNPRFPEDVRKRVLELERGARDVTPDEIRELALVAPYFRLLAARHPNAPPDLLSELSVEPGPDAEVALNPSAGPDLLGELADRWADQPGMLGRIASSPALPESLAARFARSPVREVRLAMARNPWAKGGHLTLLAGDDDWEIQAAVASNPRTPHTALLELVTSTDPDVRQALASNPLAPQEFLRTLVFDPDPDIRATLAANPNTPLDLLLELLRDGDFEVRGYAAAHMSLDPEVAAVVLEDPHPKVALAVRLRLGQADDKEALKAASGRPLFLPLAAACSAFVSQDLLSRLARHGSPAVRAAAACNPLTPPEAIALLRGDSDFHVKSVAQAADTTADKTLLSRIHAKDNRIATALAANPRVSEQRLMKFELRTEWSIKAALAHNPSSPDRLLERLIAVPSIRPIVANNPNLRAELRERIDQLSIAEALDPATAEPALHRLFRFGSTPVREALATHGSLACAVVELLLAGPEEGPRVALASNAQLAPEYVHRLVADTSPEVRASVAMRADLPEDLAERLVRDKSIQVQRALALNEHLPTSTLYRLARDCFDNVLIDIISNPRVDSQTLDLCAHRSTATWLSVARHPLTPGRTLEFVANSLLGTALALESAGLGSLGRVLTRLIPKDRVELARILAAHSNIPARLAARIRSVLPVG